LKVLIIFNSSQAVEQDDIGIVASLNGMPIDILAASFGISEEYFKAIRKNITQTPIILRKI
jgi:oxalate decarboxylase